MLVWWGPRARQCVEAAQTTGLEDLGLCPPVKSLCYDNNTIEMERKQNEYTPGKNFPSSSPSPAAPRALYAKPLHRKKRIVYCEVASSDLLPSQEIFTGKEGLLQREKFSHAVANAATSLRLSAPGRAAQNWGGWTFLTRLWKTQLSLLPNILL